MTTKTQEFEDAVEKTIIIRNRNLPSFIDADKKRKSLKADLEKCEEFWNKHNPINGNGENLWEEYQKLKQNQRTKQNEENAKLRELLKRHLIHINDFIEKHDAEHHTSSFTVIDVALHEKTAIEKLLEENKKHE